METYIGYGFAVTDLSAEMWLEALKKSKEDYESFKAYCRELFGSDDEKTLIDNVVEWIEDDYARDGMPSATFFADLVNAKEREEHGIEPVVRDYYEYIMFESIPFIDGDPRAEYIRSPKDFIKMISKYIPVDTITFGGIYEYSTYTEPHLYAW